MSRKAYSADALQRMRNLLTNGWRKPELIELMVQTMILANLDGHDLAADESVQAERKFRRANGLWVAPDPSDQKHLERDPLRTYGREL